jgi:hypothetical protein
MKKCRYRTTTVVDPIYWGKKKISIYIFLEKLLTAIFSGEKSRKWEGEGCTSFTVFSICIFFFFLLPVSSTKRINAFNTV